MKCSKLITTLFLILILLLPNITFGAEPFIRDLENLADKFILVKRVYEKINIFEAWKKLDEIEPNFLPVTIGIVDTGVDSDHPEFAGEIINGQLVGKVNFGNSFLFFKKDGDPNGHGTQVAGIIGASNISAFKTLAPDSPQMNGIISGATTNYVLESRRTLGTVIDTLAITWKLAKFGVPIINVGLTNVKREVLRPDQLNVIEGQITTPLFTIYNAIWRSLFQSNPNVLFVIPAGNSDTDASNETPSNLARDLSNVIAVGGLDGLAIEDKRDVTPPEGSNFGAGVTISAPASGVYAPKPFSPPLDFGDYDGNFGGTSASASMVTGVAGLIKAIKPELTPAQIKQILIETGDPISTDQPIGPRLNAERAVCHPSVLNCQPPPPTCPLSGTLSSNVILTPAQSPCVINGPLTIPAGVALTIQPGVVVKFTPHAYIIVNGTLDAQGSLSQPIFFTSIKDDSVGGDTNNDGSDTSPSFGDWGAIVSNTGSNITLTHATLRFGGSGFAAGMLVNGTVHLSNSHLTHNSFNNLTVGPIGGDVTISSSELDTSFFGIQQNAGTLNVSQSNIHNNHFSGIRSLGGTFSISNSNFQANGNAMNLSPEVDFVHSGNTATNNSINGIVMDGFVFATRTWTRDLIPYVIFSEEATSTVIVASGGALNIDPGVVIKFAFPSSRIIVNGRLNSSGTSHQPIFFTSIKDDSVGGDTNNDDSATIPMPQDWTSIQINAGGTANFNHSTIRFGGRPVTSMPVGGLVVDGGTLSFSNSHLTNNFSSNVMVQSGTAIINSSELDNSGIGIAQNSGMVQVSQSSIHDNTSFGVFSGGPNIMDARNSWWGSPAGPFHPTLNPGGLGNAVSDNVNFIPFLTSDPVGNLP